MCLLIDHFLNTKILKLFFIIIDVHQDQSINFTTFIIFHIINLKVKRKYEVNNTLYWEAVLFKDKNSPNYVFWNWHFLFKSNLPNWFPNMFVISGIMESTSNCPLLCNFLEMLKGHLWHELKISWRVSIRILWLHFYFKQKASDH